MSQTTYLVQKRISVEHNIHQAAETADLKEIKDLLLNKGGDINGVNEVSFMTNTRRVAERELTIPSMAWPHVAAENGHVEVCQWLIHNEAYLNARDNVGFLKLSLGLENLKSLS